MRNLYIKIICVKFFESNKNVLKNRRGCSWFLCRVNIFNARETLAKSYRSQIAVGFSLLGWFHGYIVSNNNIHRPAWTAAGISSRQRRFHYRVPLRDAYPGEFHVHKAHQMRRRRETGLVSARGEKKGGNTEKNGWQREKKCGEMSRKIEEGTAGITVYMVSKQK